MVDPRPIYPAKLPKKDWVSTGHVVDIVAARLGRQFEVWRFDERKRASAGIDCEFARVGPTH
jgi:hypothetical protein